MKNYLRIIIAFGALIAFATPGAYSQKHTINVGNFYFEPSNLLVEVGDTIRWVWVEGHHTTTSTTIPSGAPAWDSPMTSTVTSFEYRVEVAGLYSYHCVPHSSIQFANFTAVDPAPELTVTPTNHDVGYEAGTVTFTVTSNTNWSVDATDSWISSNTDGTGNGSIVVDYQENPTSQPRVASIVVSAGDLSQTVTVSQEGSTVSVNENDLNNFRVYPNPSSGIVDITTFGNKMQSGKTTIRVFDTKGNLVYEDAKTDFLSGRIDLSQMTGGTYLIQLENKNQVYTNRIALID